MATKKNRIYTVSICLSDIPAHKILMAGKGEKKMYCEMVVADKRETDQYGYDAKVYCKQTKKEIEASADKSYIGRGKITQFNDSNEVDTGNIERNRIYTINVCLSDIPKEAIQLFDKEGSKSNGKSYVDLCVADKKEVDQYGYDTSVYVRQTKAQREANEDRQYCGRGKMDVFGQGGTPIDNNPWAVGSGGNDGDEQRGGHSNYAGSGFTDENTNSGGGNTFFGSNLGKDDLPF